MTASPACIEFIKHHEGCSLVSYPDPASGSHPWTIGYGHTGPDVWPGQTITLVQANGILARDVAKVEEAVNECVKVPLTQGQFDALVSFTFNLGATALHDSTLLKLLNAGDTAGASREFHRWQWAGGKKCPGLLKRRLNEVAMFLGTRPADAPKSA